VIESDVYNRLVVILGSVGIFDGDTILGRSGLNININITKLASEIKKHIIDRITADDTKTVWDIDPSFRHSSGAALIDIIVRDYNTVYLKPDRIEIDTSGLGLLVFEQLKTLGLPVFGYVNTKLGKKFI
jgi:hypothetical protein